MFVPRTAGEFRGTVSSLRSLDENMGVIFKTFCPGGPLPASAGQEPKQRYTWGCRLGELWNLGIYVQLVLQPRSGR
jgi:hypothetical protein